MRNIPLLADVERKPFEHTMWGCKQHVSLIISELENYKADGCVASSGKAFIKHSQ
jgi:hypothetical protein